MGEWKVVIEIKREREQSEVAVGSGSWGRLGSLSMGSAHFFFKSRVSPLQVGRCAYLH